MKFIRFPKDHPLPQRAGGKASALAALHGRGPEIPDWFVVLPEAPEHGFPTPDGDAAPSPDTSLPPEVMAELTEALRQLCPHGGRVAVRSSAVGEDGAEASFAGQLTSFLNVNPADVATKILEVRRSAFSPRVQTYRASRGLSAPLPTPAVLVQRMVQAEAAGVVFGVDPVSGRRDLMIVSAVAGLGDALVNGSDEGASWEVTLPEESVRQLTAPDTGGKVLDEGQVRAVGRLAREAGDRFGCPQDVEWAFAGGQLYLLQSRPVTALPPGGELNIWDNSNITESYPGMTLPLTFSFARRAYTGVYREFCRMLAVPASRIAAHGRTFENMIGLIRGRVYYNLLNWYRVLSLLPGFRLNRRFMEQMMGVKEELPVEALGGTGPAAPGSRFMDGLHVTRSVAALALNHLLLPWKIRRFHRRLNAALAPPPQPLDTLTPEALVAHFDELEARLLSRWDAPLLNDFFAMIFHGVLGRLLGQWIPEAGPGLMNDLLCGGSGMISAEPARRIHAMAGLAAPHQALGRALTEGSLTEIEAEMESAPAFRTAYQNYLAEFGDRCPGELKLESPALTEDPMTLLSTVGQLAGRGETGQVPQDSSHGREVRRRAESRVRDALRDHPVRHAVLGWVLRQARDRMRDRENLRFERTRLFGRVRRLFAELGRRLQASGHLDDARGVFLLEVDELREFVTGNAGAARLDLQALATRRGKTFEEYARMDPPPGRFSTRGPVDGTPPWLDIPPPAKTGDGTTRRGLGCCAGRVRGRVRKVLDPSGAIVLQGEILVAARTDPGWILLFPAAAGLLVERGSMLSHSAIVARELNLPAVVSIEGLTDWLEDGDEVEFDGATGEVRRLATTEGPLPCALPSPPAGETAFVHAAPLISS